MEGPGGMLGGQSKRFVVTGTPGIGKSVFLSYLLWRLVTREPAWDGVIICARLVDPKFN